MIESGPQDAKCARPQDRRVYERFELSDARGSLIYQGMVIPCTLIDISLGGCCLRTETPFEAGALANVEVALAIYGLDLRIGGVTQWTRWDHQIGVRFLYEGAQSRNQLVGLLTCLVDNNAVAVVQQAVASERLVNSAVAQPAVAEIADSMPTLETREQEDVQQQPAEEQPVHRDQRRVQNLDEGHGPAVVHFLKDNIDCRGDVVDLSLDGCSVRTEATYAWKLHLRVEVIFHMRGLPFQLAGVTSAIHDRRTAGIHFLEISRRKREELGQVIDELIEISKAKQETREAEPVPPDSAAEDT